MSRISRGHQRNKLNLILDNSELDYLEHIIIKSNEFKKCEDYILEKINKIKVLKWIKIN